MRRGTGTQKTRLVLQAPSSRALQPRWLSSGRHRAGSGCTQAAGSWVSQAGCGFTARGDRNQGHQDPWWPECGSGNSSEQKAPTVLPCVAWRGAGGAGRPSFAMRDRLGHPWGQEGGTHITAGVLETTAAAVIFHKKRLYWGRPRDRSRERGFTRGWTASVWSPGTWPRVQASGAGGPKGTGLRPRRMGRAGGGLLHLPPCLGTAQGSSQ